jgi:transcription elongation factor GreA
VLLCIRVPSEPLRPARRDRGAPDRIEEHTVTETQQVWLTQDAYERLTDELAELLRQRSEYAREEAASGVRERDADDERHLAEQRERNQRIRKLQELLQNPAVGQEPPDDGIAEPGMVLTVRYEGDAETETFLLAGRDEGLAPGVEVCSPESPLGRAIAGAKEGERRQYPLPDGRMMTVQLVRAVPYRHAG